MSRVASSAQVHVLEHQQHGRLGQHLAHPTEQAEPARARLVVCGHRELGQGIQDRAQRLGRRDAVTRTAPDHQPAGGLGQGRRQRRLADASLPAQEHEPAAALPRLAKQPLQRNQETLPLNQHIRHSTRTGP